MLPRHVIKRYLASPRPWGLRLALLLAAALGIRSLLIVNPVSGSMPAGFYLRMPSQLHPPLALLCLPENLARLGRARGYLGLGVCPGHVAAALKPVVAAAGDEVSLDHDGVRVNGRLLPNSAPRRQDHLGRPLRSPAPTRFQLLPGSILAISSYTPRSWDGRYWGPLPTSAVRAWATPLLLAAPLTPTPASDVNGVHIEPPTTAPRRAEPRSRPGHANGVHMPIRHRP